MIPFSIFVMCRFLNITSYYFFLLDNCLFLLGVLKTSTNIIISFCTVPVTTSSLYKKNIHDLLDWLAETPCTDLKVSYVVCRRQGCPIEYQEAFFLNHREIYIMRLFGALALPLCLIMVLILVLVLIMVLALSMILVLKLIFTPMSLNTTLVLIIILIMMLILIQKFQ